MHPSIPQELQSFADPSKAVIFYSAHGVPKSYVEEAGDPYKEEMEQCVDLVQAELSRRGVDNRHVLAYQSRVGPVEWLQPYTDDSIRYVFLMELGVHTERLHVLWVRLTWVCV